MLLETGHLLGKRFRILKLLGRGGMAEVYLAEDRRLGGTLCVKLLLPHLRSDPVVCIRFEREVATARGLAHSNIVRIFELCESDGWLYFTMEYLDGPDLKRRLRSRGPLPPRELAELGSEVALALDAAHEQGIVHRDVKPQNILLPKDRPPVLVDFGLAHMANLVGLSMGSMMLGTPEYSAPELLDGAVPDPRADLYSLGVVLYEMATGKLPFRSRSLYGVLRQQVETTAPSILAQNPDLPRWLEKIVACALSKDPEDRFQTAGEMGEMLRRQDAALQALTRTLAPHPARPCPRCRTPLLPSIPLCLECGYEPLVVGNQATGTHVLVLKGPGWGWVKQRGIYGGQDPLTYEQKWRFAALLQELCGNEQIPVHEMDLRLRNLPTVVFDRLSQEDGEKLMDRFGQMEIPTEVRQRFALKNADLVTDSTPVVTLVAMILFSAALFVTLPFFNLQLIGSVAFGTILATFGLKLALLKPLARLPGKSHGSAEASPLVSLCREILPTLRTPRLKKLVRKILLRYTILHNRLHAAAEGPTAALADEAETFETLGRKALELAVKIQTLEDSMEPLQEAELVEAVQRLDVAIDEETNLVRTDQLILERKATMEGLNHLAEAEETLSALYGHLVRASATFASVVARLGALEGKLELADPTLPRAFAAMELVLDRAAKATEKLLPEPTLDSS